MCHVSSLTLVQAAALLRAGKISSVELVKHGLKAMERHEKTLNAMVHIADSALHEAVQCDAEAAQGSFRGALHGIPLVIKDNIDVQGMPTTVGSPIFANLPPVTSDAVIISRLRDAGAIVLGKANMDEFAAHVSGRTSFFGSSVNPWYPERRLSPGGSSSGTATAVAAGYCCAGLGTDTGGSVRLPAGWCGLCALRPTHGQISVSGVYPRAKSLDTVGVMARSVQDVETLFSVIADEKMRIKLRQPSSIGQLRIGIFPHFVAERSHPEVTEAYTATILRWKNIATCIPVEFPLLDDPEVVRAMGIIRSYEFARDIAHDIERNPQCSNMHSIPFKDYEAGKKQTSESYQRALQYKQELSEAMKSVFSQLDIDCLLLPVAFSTAPSLDAPEETFTEGRTLVNLFSLTGVPTLIVPGAVSAKEMPLGMQLVGPSFSERFLLDAGRLYEAHYGLFPQPSITR